MPDTFAPWVGILIGVAFVIFRKQAVRSNEAFQRFVYRDMEPFNPDTREGWEIVYAIAGAFVAIVSALVLLGVLPAPN